MAQKARKDNSFIKKLTQITEANYINSQFGVNELAEYYGISHSQLHRKLKAITNKSASQFIREIRLQKAKEMLLQNRCTVAETAFQVGFGSPTYFNKCFHDYFGCPPGDIGNFEDENIGFLNEESIQAETPEANSRDNWFLSKINWVIAIGILILIVSCFYALNYFYGDQWNNKKALKSIAVLPLRSLSNDSESEYLADGIMDDIVTRLSQIGELAVTSRITAEKNWDEKMTLPEIAKQLDVSYILEGSILKEGKKVRIYVHLVDAENDNAVWSSHYDDTLDDIFTFVSEVSGQIARELEAVVSPEQKESLSKKYTKSVEAYNLYSEGRFYWRYSDEQKIMKSIDLFNQALAVDSNYCLPYVGLADAYLHLSFKKKFELRKGLRAKSREYALQALRLENNLAEAHATLGGLYLMYDFEWDLAEKEFKKALQLNPNYALTYEWYSEYFYLTGNKKEARKLINEALARNPHSLNIRLQSFRFYFGAGEYNEAAKESKKLFSDDKNSRKLFERQFDIYLKQEKYREAVDEYKKFIPLQSVTSEAKIDSIYAESGIEGLIRLIIELELKQKWTITSIVKNMIVAKNYALLNEKDSSLCYLEKAFENDENGIIGIKYDPNYEKLRSEPRFLALLEKLNLGGY